MIAVSNRIPNKMKVEDSLKVSLNFVAHLKRKYKTEPMSKSTTTLHFYEKKKNRRKVTSCERAYLYLTIDNHLIDKHFEITDDRFTPWQCFHSAFYIRFNVMTENAAVLPRILVGPCLSNSRRQL